MKIFDLGLARAAITARINTICERGSDRGQSSSQDSDGRGPHPRTSLTIGLETGVESAAKEAPPSPSPPRGKERIGKVVAMPWLFSAQIRSSSVRVLVRVCALVL